MTQGNRRMGFWRTLWTKYQRSQERQKWECIWDAETCECNFSPLCNFPCGAVCVTVRNRIRGKINTKLPTSDARPPFNDTSDAQDALAKMWELFQMRRRYQLKVIWRRMFDASVNILKIHFWVSYYFPGLFLYFFLVCSMTRPSRSMEDKYGNECKKDLKTKRKKI